MSITHQEALKALEAAIAKADELGVKVAIAVVDDHADLVALVRMSDVNFLFLPQAAQGKAMASVVWHQPSGALAERAAAPLMASTNQVYQGQLFYQQGAVPVTRDGKIVGAVGAAGASGQQDEDVSAAAAALLGS